MIVLAKHANRKVPRVPMLLPTKGLGFKFTADDCRMMRYNCVQSDKFMANFGLAPEQPLIDLSHYANNQQPNDGKDN